MINIKHLLKAVSAWISIVYVVCYAVVASYPMMRIMFMRYAMHGQASFTSDYFGLPNFISGLIIWNVVALLGAALFAYLFNSIKE